MTCALLVLAALAQPAAATQWRFDAAPAAEGTPVERALAALTDLPEMDAPSVLPVSGGHVVRVQQTLHGLPVIGASLAARVDRHGAVTMVRDDARRGLRIDPTPRVDLDQARTAAGIAPAVSVQADLAVLPEGTGRLVWRLVVPDLQGGELVLVDAHSGRLLGRRPLAMHALGRVYAENPIATPETSDLELASLDADAGLTGFDGNLRVTRYVSGDPFLGTITVAQDLGPSDGADYLYDPPTDTTDPTDAFAEVSTYYHLAQARLYFQDLGVDFTPASFELVAVANLLSSGNPLDNAFYSPAGLTGADGAPNLIGIGQGSVLDFAADADVFVHEFGHYVSNNVVGANQGQFYTNEYGFSPWVGAIDEGIADYFAASLFDDPVMGEYSLATFGAERDLSADYGRCPEDVIGEVHYDGQLIGGLSWAVREAYGAEVADPLVLGALGMLGSDSSLGEFATALRALAEELQAAGELDSLDALDAAISERGLDACGVVQDLSAGPVTQGMLGLDEVAAYFGLTCSLVADLASMHSFFHVSAPTDPDATGLQLDVDLDPLSGGDLSWQLYLRQGDPVTMATSWLLPEPAAYDLVSETFTDPQGSVVIEGEDFTPGETWYGVIVHSNCPTSRLTVTATQLGLPEDSGGGDDTGPGSVSNLAEEPGGCACAVAVPGSGGAGLLGMLLLWVRRRREEQAPSR